MILILKYEKIIKDIIKRNVGSTDNNNKLTLIIYCCNTKVNNLTKNTNELYIRSLALVETVNFPIQQILDKREIVS